MTSNLASTEIAEHGLQLRFSNPSVISTKIKLSKDNHNMLRKKRSVVNFPRVDPDLFIFLFLLSYGSSLDWQLGNYHMRLIHLGKYPFTSDII